MWYSRNMGQENAWLSPSSQASSQEVTNDVNHLSSES